MRGFFYNRISLNDCFPKSNFPGYVNCLKPENQKFQFKLLNLIYLAIALVENK